MHMYLFYIQDSDECITPGFCGKFWPLRLLSHMQRLLAYRENITFV